MFNVRTPLALGLAAAVAGGSGGTGGSPQLDERGRIHSARANDAPAGRAVRPRARDLGVAPGVLPPGPLGAITDVPGVSVGHATRIEGDRVRTGVTAIVPHAGNVFQEKVAGAVFVGNAFGKLAGSTQVDELGTIETPIVLTNTLSVGTAVEAVVRDTLGRPGNEDVRSVNATTMPSPGARRPPRATRARSFKEGKAASGRR